MKNKWVFVAFAMIWMVLFVFITTGRIARAQSTPTLTERIQRVTARPEFAHANFGIEFFSLDSGKVIYALNPEKMFVPASTTKLLTEGALLAKLGADYRFHTRIYRTGPIDSKGKLKGDLILVASGDPNLSNRAQPDGTLAFVDEDHSYNGPALPGDPLAVIKDLAGKISAKGIKRIDGRLLIDTSLFPDGGREGGTDVVMSSIMVNDNVIDLVIRPGAKGGDATILEYSPRTSCVKFINQVTTGTQDSKPNLESPEVETNEDGSVLVTLTGSLPAGTAPQTVAFAVPSPTTFAATVLREALVTSGVQFKKRAATEPPGFAAYSRFYVPENLVAEHVSAPLSEEIKVTLKVSQNLHAGMGPYLLGAVVAKDLKNPLAAGFRVEREFLRSANLDLSGACARRWSWRRLGGSLFAGLYDSLFDLLEHMPGLPSISESFADVRQGWNSGDHSEEFSRRWPRFRKNGNVRLRGQAERKRNVECQRIGGVCHHQIRGALGVRRLCKSRGFATRSRCSAAGCRASLGRNSRGSLRRGTKIVWGFRL